MAEVIVALDLPGADEALALVDRVPGLRWVKVGSILFTREGAPLVRALRARGLSVFLDLKWHDIPNTVAGAVAQAAELGVSMATVHTLGGPAMLAAAARAAAGSAMEVVGVTVLTSHTADELARIVGRAAEPTAEVRRLAAMAIEAGLAGCVCSPLEVGTLREALGAAPLLVVPGIRPPGSAADDQARVASAAEARQAGATHLVVGRPVLQAADPAAAFAALRQAGA